MLVTKINDSNGGRRVYKKKFILAVATLLAGYLLIFYVVVWKIATWTVTDLSSLLASLSTFTLAVLAPIYAADIADKKLNGKLYDDTGGSGTG